MQMYRIYIKEQVILITKADKNVKVAGYELITEDEILPVTDGLAYGKIRADYLHLTAEPASVMERLTHRMNYIEAAGGIVINERGQLLFIFRHGKWDLPKGKLEPGELPGTGGIREVEEECNVHIAGITRELEPTWHAYELKENTVLKKTWWYLMSCADDRHMQPQTDEGITEVRWFNPDELEVITSNTYPLIKGIIEKLQPGTLKRP